MTVDPADGEAIPFGTSDDVTVRYDAGADDLWVGDGGGARTDWRSTGDPTISGTLTEDAAP